MPRVSIDLTVEMYNALRQYSFDNGVHSTVVIRELIRQKLETELGIELNANIGEPGKPSIIGVGVLKYRSATEAKLFSEALVPKGSRIDLAKGISKLLDQPLPPRTFQELCQSIIGASELEVRDALARLGKQVSEDGSIV